MIKIMDILTNAKYEGETYDECVAKMMYSSPLLLSKDLFSYMESVKGRVREWNGYEMQFDDSESFLVQLEAAGLIILFEGTGAGVPVKF